MPDRNMRGSNHPYGDLKEDMGKSACDGMKVKGSLEVTHPRLVQACEELEYMCQELARGAVRLSLLAGRLLEEPPTVHPFADKPNETKMSSIELRLKNVHESLAQTLCYTETQLSKLEQGV
jgi:hypothetical protein